MSSSPIPPLMVRQNPPPAVTQAMHALQSACQAWPTTPVPANLDPQAPEANVCAMLIEQHASPMPMFTSGVLAGVLGMMALSLAWYIVRKAIRGTVRAVRAVRA